MPRPNPTRPYSIPGFRIALVREPGVKLAERPQLRYPAEAVPMLAWYIGEAGRYVSLRERGVLQGDAMVRGLRVVFSPASWTLYSYRVPEPGARGTVTAARTAGRVRTYLVGPGGPLVYVRWDGDGLVCCVSMRDLKLELPEDEQRR